MKLLLPLLCFCLPVFSAPLTPQEEARQFIRLVEACQEGNVEIVRECLDRGVDPNRSGSLCLPPLFHAAAYGNLETAQILVERGASLEYFKFNSPLNLAIQSGNIELIHYFLQQGAPLGNPRDPRAYHAARDAVFMDSPEILDLLVAHGMDLKTWNTYGYSLLTQAAEFEAVNVLTYLLRRGFDPNTPDAENRTALVVASKNIHSCCVEPLLDAGANPNFIGGAHFITQGVPYVNYCALLNACMRNDANNVQKLLKHGADPSISAGLCVAVADMLGNQEIYDLLIKAGAQKPAPYAYLDLLREFALKLKEPNENPWEIESLSQNISRPAFPSSQTPFTLALIPGGSSLRDLEAVLQAGLTEIPGCQLVERSDLSAVGREFALARMDPSTAIQAGSLLSADMLLILDQLSVGIRFSIVDTETGRVLDTGILESGKDLDKTVNEIVSRSAAARGGLELGLNDLIPISVPALIPDSGDALTFRMAENIKRDIEIMLAQQMEVQLLERDLLRELSQEKSLGENQRAYFASGWLLDGSVQVEGEDPSLLTLRLRARQSGSDAEHRFSEQGPLTAYRSLMKKSVNELLARIHDSVPPPAGKGDESQEYLRNANRAANANQWRTAARNANAAWTLGNRSDQVMDILVRSSVHAIRESGLAINRRTDDQLRGLRELALYRSRMHVLNRDAAILGEDELFNIVDAVLDVYESVLRQPEKLKPFELDLLAFLPTAARCAAQPLDLYPSLSDKTRYSARLESIRERILQLLSKTRALAETYNLPTIYDAALASEVELLPYLYLDAQRAYQEVHQIFLEADAFAYPHNKHLIFSTAFTFSTYYARSRSSSDRTRWQSFAKQMTESESLNEAVIGLYLQTEFTTNHAEKWRLWEEMSDKIQEALFADMSAGGTTHTDFKNLQLNEDVRIRNSYTSEPFYKTKLWYPQVSRMPLQSQNWESTRLSMFYEDWTTPDADRPDPFNYSGMMKMRPTHRRQLIYQDWALFLSSYSRRTGVPLMWWDDFLPREITSLEVLKQIQENLLAGQELMVTSSEYSENRITQLQRFYLVTLKEVEKQIASLRTVPEKLITLQLDGFQFFNGNPSQPRYNVGLEQNFADKGMWLITDFNLILLGKDGRILSRIAYPDDFECHMDDMFTDIQDASDDTRLALRLYRTVERDRQRLGVYTFETGEWLLFPMPEFPDSVKSEGHINELESLLLVGDHLVYSYMKNTGEGPRGRLHQTVDDPMREIGISALNIRTSEHLPLVRNRRVPAQSPLDDFQESIYHPSRVNPSTFGLGKSWYSFETSSWFESKTLAPKTQFYAGWYAAHSPMEINGFRVTPGKDNPDSTKAFFNIYRPKPRIYTDIPFTYVYPDWMPIKGHFHNLEYKNADGDIAPMFLITGNRYGLLAYNSIGFCFIPKDELEATLRSIIDMVKKKYNEPVVGAAPE